MACFGKVLQLLTQIETPSQDPGSPNLGNFLQNLGIFDLRNVFVCCLDLQIANNRISVLNLNNPDNPPCMNSSRQQLSFNQIVSNAGVYVVVGNSERLRCNSNIIYIGSSGDLQDRIKNFFRTLERPQNNTQQSSQNNTQQYDSHTGANCIRKRLLQSTSGNTSSQNTSRQASLCIFGFPIQTEISLKIAERQLNAINKCLACIAEIAEACFIDTYRLLVSSSLNRIRKLCPKNKKKPCCVSRAPSCNEDYYKFLNSSNPSQAQQDILEILKAINLTF